MRDSVDAVKKLEIKQEQLAAKEQAIGTITSDLIMWSKVLYELAGLVPEDLWLNNLKVDVSSTKVTKDNPDPDASQKTITETIITRKLKVGGYAMSPRAERGVELVGQLVRAMEDDPGFSKRFSDPTPQGVFDDEFDSVSVKRFEIETVIESGGPSK